MTRVLIGGALGVVFATVFVVGNVLGHEVPEGPPNPDALPYVRLYEQPRTRLEKVLNQGDGQAYAALAQDPLLRRPEAFREGRAEAAYRAQRPLLGWLTWLGSGGQPGLVPITLATIAVVSSGLLAGAGVAFAQWRGAPWWTGATLVLLPGSIVVLDWFGPETLATALGLAGVLWWCRSPAPRAAAIVALCLAALARETLLLVPAALAVAEVVRRRPWHHVAMLGLPVFVYAAWVVVVRLRLGVWPFEASTDRLAFPLTGMMARTGDWESTEYVSVVLAAALAAGALVLARDAVLRWIVVAHIGLALLLGEAVWGRWEDFSRPLLPLYAFALLAVLPRESAPDPNTCS